MMVIYRTQDYFASKLTLEKVNSSFFSKKNLTLLRNKDFGIIIDGDGKSIFENENMTIFKNYGKWKRVK